MRIIDQTRSYFSQGFVESRRDQSSLVGAQQRFGQGLCRHGDLPTQEDKPESPVVEHERAGTESDQMGHRPTGQPLEVHRIQVSQCPSQVSSLKSKISLSFQGNVALV